MDELFSQLLFSLSTTGPIFLMLALGIFFKRINLINDNFIEVGSRLVFQVTLPAMLFLSIVTFDHDFAAASDFLSYGVISNIAFFLLATISVKFFFASSPNQGVLIQGAYRANLGIIGIAYVSKAYGPQAIGMAALYVAIISFLYNIQAVICLSPKGTMSFSQTLKLMFRTLTRNPLIIGISLGLIFYFLSIPLPSAMIDAGNYLSKMSLPLALLCTGGSLNFALMKKEKGAAWFAASYKLILAPVLLTLIAYLIGFREMELGMLFFMNSAPVAAASYVMARAMGHDSVLAANIIAITTLLSAFTCTLGMVALSALGLI